MRSDLPLEVLGLLAPVLSWVEGHEGIGLPQRGRERQPAFGQRQEAWLHDELPIYSRDTIDEILELRTDPDAAEARELPQTTWRSSTRSSLHPVSPPRGYDLAPVLRRLCRRYLDWNGNELCVRAGLMEELHLLAARVPLCHLIRYRHAKAVLRGWMSPHVALDLPDRLGALHSASRSLRAVVERGVGEGHLHLWGVLSADETWADHLLGKRPIGRLRRFREPDSKLFRLGRVALSTLAIAVLRAAQPSPRHSDEIPYKLLSYFDRLHRAHDLATESWLLSGFHQALDRARVDALVNLPMPQRTDKFGDGTWRWLFSLVDPTAKRLFAPPVNRAISLNPAWRRIRLLDRLHLEVQRLLIELAEDIDALTPASEKPDAQPITRGRAAERRGHKRSTAPGDDHWIWLGKRLQRDFLHQAFFRYLICHTQFLQRTVQYGQTTGLRNFSSFASAAQRSPGSDDEARDVTLARLLQDESMRFIEGRVSPPRSPAELAKWLEAHRRHSHRRPGEKFGFIIHFAKLSRDQFLDDRERMRRGGPGAHWSRFSSYRYTLKQHAFRVYRLLTQPHPAVPFVVGIDAASKEIHTPPSLLAPVFRFLRDVPMPITARPAAGNQVRFLEQQRHIADLMSQRRLGVTYHVGEDFRHLLSGLRAIHEVIEFLDMRPGDRLGHAIALALDPAVWLDQVGSQAVLPNQEWLDDLVWLLQFLGAGHDTLGELQIEDRIQYMSWSIYEDPEQRRSHWRAASDDHEHRRDQGGQVPWIHRWSPLVLHDAWRLRQLDPDTLDFTQLRSQRRPPSTLTRMPVGVEERRWQDIQRAILRRIQPHVGSFAAYDLLDLYWHDPAVRQRGDRMRVEDMASEKQRWISVLRAVQDKLSRLIQARQLVVEVNPSSNRLVGPMRRLSEHPVFKLTVDDKHQLARNIAVTISTDDPGVFNTSLAHEYYLLGEVLLSRGVPEGEVSHWLNWLRKNGADTTFLSSLPALDDQAVEHLLNATIGNTPRLIRSQGDWNRWLWRKRSSSP